MKTILTSGYAFTAATQRLDFTGKADFDVRRLLAVINLTRNNAIIYAAGSPGLGYASIGGAGKILALTFDTTSYSNSDSLAVFYDEPGTASASDASAAKQDEAKALLTQILTALGLVAKDASLTNKATAAKQDDATAVLQSILTVLQAQRVETIWTDDTGTRFIRVDIGGAIVWTNVAGGASAAPGAGARPDAASAVAVSRSLYSATASGTGYTTGDYLEHFVTSDAASGDPMGNFWVNATAGTKIAAPPAGNISPMSALPTGAATSALQTAGNTLLASIVSALAGTLTVTGPLTNAQLRAAALAVTQPADQDPIFDHAAGKRVEITASGAVLTPPAGCKYLRITSTVDLLVNTANIDTVADDGTAILVLANTPEVIPVVAGTPVKALSTAGTAVVRATPLKAR